jgi:hypothetical protein
MSNQMRSFPLEPDAGTSVRNPVGGQLVFKVSGEQANGAMTVFETVAAPQEGRHCTSTSFRTSGSTCTRARCASDSATT